MIAIEKINNVIKKGLFYLEEHKKDLDRHRSSKEELELIISREDSLENCAYELREHDYHDYHCRSYKERIECAKATILSYKMMASFILDFGYLDKIERHILPEDFISYATKKYSLLTPQEEYEEYEELSIVLRYSFKNEFYSPDLRDFPTPGFVGYLYSPWEYREIIAVYKHLAASHIRRIILSRFQETSNSAFYIKDSIEELYFLEKLENLITYGMLDVCDNLWWFSHFDSCVDYGYCLGTCNCDDPEFCNHEYCSACQTGVDLETRTKRLLSKLLNNDFGKHVGIDFRKLRYEKAQAKKAELDAELKSLMGFK